MKGKDLQAQIDNPTAVVETLQSNPGVDFKSIYPIGSIYISTDNTNPADLFSGTQWEAIGQGRTLIGAGTGQDNNGTQKTFNNGEAGGEYSHKLLTSEMPVHSHSGTTNTTGNHTHTRGSMNITGWITAHSYGESNGFNHSSGGAFYRGGTYYYKDGNSQAWKTSDGGIQFNASRSWTGETSSNGNHNHTFTTNNAGGDGFHNNIQPYLVVYMWKRIS